MFNVARITDPCTHGARIKTGSSDRLVEGLLVARLGDIVDCPQHGDNPIIQIDGSMPLTNGLPTAHGTAKAQCGAEIIVSVTQNSGGCGGGDIAESVAMETEDMTASERRAYMRERFCGAADAMERALGSNAGETPLADEIKDANLTSKIVGCEDFTDSSPDSTRLSKYFTVGMLSSQIYQSANRHTIPSRTAKGLTRAAVLCNMKHLATNSLDSAVELAKSMGMTIKVGSGFRNRSGTSDHNAGSAADLHVFKNGARVSRKQLRDLAEAFTKKLPFTQIILEFAGSRSSGWIHLANRRNGRKSRQPICFTFTGGSPYTNGLPRL